MFSIIIILFLCGVGWVGAFVCVCMHVCMYSGALGYQPRFSKMYSDEAPL